MTGRNEAAEPNDTVDDKAAGGARAGREAPHRRRAGHPRFVERGAVLVYRSAEWAIGHAPERPARALGGWLFSLGYHLWPEKRRFVNANFGHVLGLPADHPEVRRLALGAYRNYARYVVELMRLTSQPVGAAGDRLDLQGLETFEAIRAESKGLILVGQHMGNNEAVAAGIARHGWPISVVADDSTFPEIFEHLRAVRASWGVHLIPWRNLREVFSVLKRGEMLGLLVDWGYKADGIPVRLFGAPTRLPAGPAYLAAKTGATILPITIRRRADGRFFVTHDEPIRVTSTDDAALAEATQRIADALERTLAAAPDQWYSFKPIWPDGPEEAAHVERDLRGARPVDAVAEAS